MAGADKGRVLVLDDEQGVRQSIATVLAQNGFEVSAAASAREALALHAKLPCDLMLVDKNLPEESGIDFIRSLRDGGDAVPIIVMTAYGSVESAIQGLHLRIAAYIEKPFDDIFAIVSLVEQVLRRSREVDSAASGVAVNHFRKAKAALTDAVAVSAEAVRPVRILVVTPNPLDREDVAHWLARGEDVVEHCKSGMAGLNAVARGDTDLVVVDAATVSPDITAFIEQLHAQAPATICIVIADHPSLSTVARLIRLDVHAVLEKPVDERQVRERLYPIMQQLRRPEPA